MADDTVLKILVAHDKRKKKCLVIPGSDLEITSIIKYSDFTKSDNTLQVDKYPPPNFSERFEL